MSSLNPTRLPAAVYVAATVSRLLLGVAASKTYVPPVVAVNRYQSISVLAMDALPVASPELFKVTEVKLVGGVMVAGGVLPQEGVTRSSNISTSGSTLR